MREPSKREQPTRTSDPAQAQTGADVPGESKATFRVESLEQRILMSATWLDADTGAAESGPTEGDDEFVAGGTHADHVDALGGDDVLFGDQGDDILAGGAGDDEIHGGHHNDLLLGGAGDDRLYGDFHNDVLVSGGGDDHMDGGKHDDTFRFDGAHDGDVVTVVGGEGNDTIDLSPYAANHVSNNGSSITVDLGGGDSFQINHSGVEHVVTAAAVNDPPTVDAGTDQSVDEGALVHLSGVASDAEGQPLSYQWVQTSGPGVALSDPHSSNPTFTAPQDVANSDVTFELHVSDGINTSVDSVTITVNADDDAPSADAGSDQVVDEGALVQLSAAASDAQGQSLNYEWAQTSGPSVALNDPYVATPTFTVPEGVENSEVTFELRVSDGTHISVDSVTITVNAAADVQPIDSGVDIETPLSDSGSTTTPPEIGGGTGGLTNTPVDVPVASRPDDVIDGPSDPEAAVETPWSPSDSSNTTTPPYIGGGTGGLTETPVDVPAASQPEDVIDSPSDPEAAVETPGSSSDSSNTTTPPDVGGGTSELTDTPVDVPVASQPEDAIDSPSDPVAAVETPWSPTDLTPQTPIDEANDSPSAIKPSDVPPADSIAPAETPTVAVSSDPAVAVQTPWSPTDTTAQIPIDYVPGASSPAQASNAPSDSYSPDSAPTVAVSSDAMSPSATPWSPTPTAERPNSVLSSQSSIVPPADSITSAAAATGAVSSDWDGTEDLRVLDARGGVEGVEFSPQEHDALVAQAAAQMVFPGQGDTVDRAEIDGYSEEVEIEIRPLNSGRPSFELPPGAANARFDDVFVELADPTGLVAQNSQDESDDRAEPSRFEPSGRVLRSRPMSGDELADGSESGLPPNALYADEPAEMVEAAQGGGFLAALWGLLRSRVGASTTTDEPAGTSERRADSARRK